MQYQEFTSESVCSGHPDKICDQISDAIVDEVLSHDPTSHLGVETMVTSNRVILAGEVKTTAVIDYEAIARSQIKRLGYTDPSFGFDDHAHIDVLISGQSPEIAVGVDNDGAGDQGIMFGYACRDTVDFMPMPITLANRLVQAIDEARQTRTLAYLRPDGKAQVTVKYAGRKPVSVSHVTIAVPHDPHTLLDQVRSDIFQTVIRPILAEYSFELAVSQLVVNGTGVWHQPGPTSDAGLTGRKIVADAYGGYARVGGGCFSGKDPTKVDRSGAYAARFIAKNIVGHGLAEQAEVALAYFIGGQKPISVGVETFGTQHATDSQIVSFVAGLIDLSVSGIIKELNLQKPIYLKTAAYGHFGRSEFPWERIVD